MSVVQNLMERLRPLVGPQGWDFCVLWKLSDDQSSLEFVDCICAGTIDAQNREELQVLVSPVYPCKDILFQHPSTKACDLLGQLPSSIPLDSGMYAQALLSSQPSWSNLSNITESGVLDETCGSRVLIPLPGRLIEMFSMKQVAEDQRVIDFVTSQFGVAMEQESVIGSSDMDVSFSSINAKRVNDFKPKLDVGNGNDQMDPNNQLQATLSQSMSLQNVNLPYDISVDRLHLCNSSMNMLQQYNCNSEDKAKSDIFFEGSHDIFNFNHNNAMSSLENDLQDIDEMQKTMMNNTGNMHLPYTEPLADQDQQGTEKDMINHEAGRSDSISDCSDQVDDEDNLKCTTNGKRPQSKNLMAERKRRKKLNDRLYALRALVPNISKLDKASILGDAIKYVKELQKQAKDLQDELEENSDDECGRNQKMQSEILINNGVMPKAEDDNPPNGAYVGASGNGSINYSKQFQDSENIMEKCQEMEPQVEVAQIDGNEFYVKVFCEHRADGFVRLMEALNSLGLEITNVNVTRFRGLVSNVFKVEKRESEFVQADHVRDSLLEVTRNPSRSWTIESTQVPDNECGMDFLHPHNHHMSSAHHLHHLHN